jgi:hypothetical protein
VREERKEEDEEEALTRQMDGCELRLRQEGIMIY